MSKMEYSLRLPQSFLYSEYLKTAVQSFYHTSSIPQAVGFSLSSKLGSWFPSSPSLRSLLLIPSKIFHEVADTRKDPDFFKKFSWVAPTAGIVLMTLASRACYNWTSSPLLRGAINGIHTTAMGILCLATEGSSLKLITLKDAVAEWLHIPADARKGKSTACAAFLTASIGQTYLGVHPIITNTASYVLATVVRVLFARAFSEQPNQNEAPFGHRSI